MGAQHTAASFDNYETWRMLSTKTAQTLYEAAEIEFSTIVGGADVGREEIQDIRTQAETIKAFLCAYVDGLAEMYCVFGCKFSGDQSAQEELYAKFGSGRNKLRNCGVKNIAKALGKLIPKSIVFNRK